MKYPSAQRYTLYCIARGQAAATAFKLGDIRCCHSRRGETGGERAGDMGGAGVGGELVAGRRGPEGSAAVGKVMGVMIFSTK